MTNNIDDILFPPIEPYSTGYLEVDKIHSLYWEQCGNPDGIPFVYLHGGPGEGCSENKRRFFDPQHYCITLFDQRGAKKSKPLGETKNNSPKHLVSDIESLRKYLGINKWYIFGGSWGSTLGILYAQAFPDRCLGLILRGISLFEKGGLDWWSRGRSNFFPELFDAFVSIVSVDKRDNLILAYYEMLHSDDNEICLNAVKAMYAYGRGSGTLLPSLDSYDWSDPNQVAYITAFYKIFIHNCMHHRFEAGQLLKCVESIRSIPGIIIQGRYDMLCPPIMAYQLHKAWPEAEYIVIPDAGHASFEPSIAKALVLAIKRLATRHTI